MVKKAALTRERSSAFTRECSQISRAATAATPAPALKPDGRGVVSRKAKKAEYFFQLRMSRQDQAELRELAQAFGMNLRTFMAQAIRGKKLDLRAELSTAKENHLDPRQLTALTTLCPVASRN